jgi:hypothetical protein
MLKRLLIFTGEVHLAGQRRIYTCRKFEQEICHSDQASSLHGSDRCEMKLMWFGVVRERLLGDDTELGGRPTCPAGPMAAGR